MGSTQRVATTSAQMKLRPLPASAAAARRFVTDTLAAWGHDDAVDIAILLVSELVTNSILHARSDVDLIVTEDDGRLRVEVRDASPEAPTVRSYDTTSITGRGLAMVQSFAARWGVQPLPAGKAVWFELPLSA